MSSLSTCRTHFLVLKPLTARLANDLDGQHAGPHRRHAAASALRCCRKGRKRGRAAAAAQHIVQAKAALKRARKELERRRCVWDVGGVGTAGCCRGAAGGAAGQYLPGCP